MKRAHRLEARCPAGSAAVAASTYFWTLSVENCGAIGMPMTRATPAARELRERVLDERLPVAHADGDRDVGARAALRSAVGLRHVMSVSGERPPMAS